MESSSTATGFLDGSSYQPQDQCLPVQSVVWPLLFESLTQLYDGIATYLDEPDRRNLSFTCRTFLRLSEQTHKRAPKLARIGVYSGPHDRVSSFIPEIPSPLGIGLFNKPERYPRETKEEDALRRSDQEPSSIARELSCPSTKVMWLCPHTGCTMQQLDMLYFDRRPMYFSSFDTIRLSCLFPKCVLWARHVLVQSFRPTIPPYDYLELRSVLKLYRLRCYNAVTPRSLLYRKLPFTKLRRAMRHLNLPLCSHVVLGSDMVISSYDPTKMTILRTSSDYLSETTQHELCAAFEKNKCQACHDDGSHTAWGFFARLLAIGDDVWLDIEIAISRTANEIPERRFFRNPHLHDRGAGRWELHASSKADFLAFVDGWWKWAEQVAEDGYDWRAPMSSGYLRHQKFSLNYFPDQPPSYDSLF